MSTAYVADTGVFVRCGGGGSDKLQRLRRAVRGAGVTLLIPRRVYAELGGEPTADEYPSGDVLDGVDEDWVEVAPELDHSDPLVSTVMDETRRFIAGQTGRDEDAIETADCALVGLGAQLLDEGAAERVLLLTTDKPAGRAAETILPRRGYEHVTYRYVSEEYLESVTSEEFQ